MRDISAKSDFHRISSEPIAFKIPEPAAVNLFFNI